MKRACAKCSQIFSPTARKGRGYSYCKLCISEKRKADWAKNKTAIAAQNRLSHVKTVYGLSSSEYEALKQKQNGRCAICLSEAGTRKAKKSLSVDHDHKTGVVRGLLCQPCNTALGMLNDDPELLHRAQKYLKGVLYGT